MSTMPQPQWNESPEPSELDLSMPEDSFPVDLFDGDHLDYLPEDDPFEPFAMPASDEFHASAAGASAFNRDEGWGWYDAESSRLSAPQPHRKANSTASARLICTPMPILVIWAGAIWRSERSTT